MKIPKVSLTWKILIGLVIGIFVGWLLPKWGLEARPLSNLFLNLIKSVIAPLIFATLVVGISGTGDIKQVGRIGGKSLLYFEIVTTLAIIIGLIVAKAGVRVQPVRISGAFEALPIGSGRIRFSRITVTIGPAIDFSKENLTKSKEDYQIIADRIMQEIASL